MKTNLRTIILPSVLVCVLALIGMSSHDPVASSRNEHLVMSVLWYQTAAEMRALSYQAFNVAKSQLDLDLARNTSKAKRAVILDIDETILNNSPHMAKLIKESKVFPYAWADWVNRAEASALPGAVEFLTYAVSKGCDVYYISNRSAATESDGTLRNLKAAGFPQVDSLHIMLMTNESSKESRRKAVEKTHRIVLLLGDNLNDHASVFEKKSVSDRFAEVDKDKDKFGRAYIVLPNPMYGDWENAVYGYQRGLTEEPKDSLRKAALTAF